MRRILLAIALGALCAQAAHADGNARFNTEGLVKVRFYFDDMSLVKLVAQYPNLRNDLISTLQDSGKHFLGISFLEDAAGQLRAVHLPPSLRAAYTGDEVLADFQSLIPPKAGVVNVLIHAYPMTPDGVCLMDEPGSNTNFQTEGDTLRVTPVNGVASGTVTVTAKLNCSRNSTALKGIADLKNTFVHEIGHIIFLPDEFVPNKNCTTPPTAGIMCRTTSPQGMPRVFTKWFLSDVQTARTAYFGASRKNPVVACYEWSSFQACDTTCINTAGFPDPGATDVYNACVASQCKHICAH